MTTCPDDAAQRQRGGVRAAGRSRLRTAVVLLAAGLSRRMGNRNKLLIDIGGQPLVRRTALVYLAAGADVLAVLGHEAALIRAALAGLPVAFVENPRYAEGQPGSVRAGLNSLNGDHDAVVIALADQAALTPEDIGGLLGAFADSDRSRVLVPHYRGARGNPAVFPAEIIADIIASGPDASCRAFIDAAPHLVRRYEAADDHFIIDIDTPDDLRAFAGSQRRRWIAPAENVLPQLLAWRRNGHRTALVTLVGVEGSSPRAPGAQMAIAENGDAVGHISGGCLEGALIAEARSAMAARENRLVRYGKGSPYIDIVLPCGSGMDIYFDHDPPIGLVEQVLAELEARRPAALATDLLRGRSTLTPCGRVSAAPARSARDGETFVRIYQPALRLVIAGAGPAAMTLARLAEQADMDVEILSPDRGLLDEADRLGLTARELTAGRTPAGLKLDPWTAAAVLFHDHAWEAALLPLFLSSDCFYLGAVGSRRTHEARTESLAAAGARPEALARLRAPVGLIPTAKRPAALAVSILAEVLAEAQAGGRD